MKKRILLFQFISLLLLIVSCSDFEEHSYTAIDTHTGFNPNIISKKDFFSKTKIKNTKDFFNESFV